MNKNTKFSGLLLAVLLLGVGMVSSWHCAKSTADVHHKKVVVLGFDGMDPNILTKLMDEGRMPNLNKLRVTGDFKPLATSMPPQSPVAWSNFITGMNPGGHGIFDFIHRHSNSMIPYLSTSEVTGSSKNVTIGDWVFPLVSGKVNLLREGRAFWEALREKDIPTTIFRAPANFPPVPTDARSFSGMGTPDLLGTYGTFSFYTDQPPANRDDISGGVVYEVKAVDNKIESYLIGPANAFRKGNPETKIPFTLWLDPENPVGKIEVAGREIVLNQGEWSEWLQVEFEMMPYVQSVTGICRFYLKEARPTLKLYVTPINLDPSNPALPISTPEDYSHELYEEIGYFYTAGIPEDTKALSWGVFDYPDFVQQAHTVMDESQKLFDYEWSRFKGGMLFFYFGSVDQNHHILWRTTDPNHPAYNAAEAERFGDTIYQIYEVMDRTVGRVLARIDAQTTLIVMSDHGFAPYYRSFNLNTWLKNNGYVKFRGSPKPEELRYFNHVDWSRTTAYAVGLNGLYINLRGREAEGIVAPGKKRDELMRELTEKLLAVRDPKNDQPIIQKMYRAEDIYSGPYTKDAPDLLVGYSRGYRASWEATLGSFPDELFVDNMDPWSGDHCMAMEIVPGVILSNRKIAKPDPYLYDLAPTILAEFGIPKEEQMVGSSIFAEGEKHVDNQDKN
jgi:predicted AlkP superfamily phosphohydrolase/phosphomutase